MRFTGWQTPVWIACGTGYWKEVILIKGDTDRYGYMIKLSYSSHVYIILWHSITLDILVMLHRGQLDCMKSGNCDMGYIAYRWGFFCLVILSMYQSHKSKVWVCITSFVHICIWHITWCLTVCLCVHILITRFSIHSFPIRICRYMWARLILDFLLIFVLYWSLSVLKCLNHFTWSCTRVLILTRHLAFGMLLVGEFLTPMNLHVQIPELRACKFSQLLIRVTQWKRWSSADRLESFPSRPPC